ncbi:MAG: hypothetical protein GY731_14565 [Gammaproteobacteria bacterium]|nr:hypothetical protein [Gammaproteobacteria bacterium]
MLGGVGVALVAGPLGCIMVWRRMAYFGAALSHSALLGVVLGFLMGVNPTVGIVFFCLLLAVMLFILERQGTLPMDTLLGIMAHGSLALGLLLVGYMDRLRIDLMGYLFGDILAIGNLDIYLIYGLLVLSLLLLRRIWTPLLTIIVSEDLAAAEGIAVGRIHLTYMLLIAVTIGVGMKIVGILLVVSLLIIPAAAARRLAATPEQMMVIAAIIGTVSVLAGLYGSFTLDVATGPAIVVVASLIFAVIFAWPSKATSRP